MNDERNDYRSGGELQPRAPELTLCPRRTETLTKPHGSSSAAAGVGTQHPAHINNSRHPQNDLVEHPDEHDEYDYYGEIDYFDYDYSDYE